jgi:ATP-dependent RNA helicase HelY
VHEADQRAIDRDHREADALRASIEHRSGSLVRDLHLLVEVLRRRGYLEEGTDRLTRRGRRLSGIYATTDLLVAEVVEAGLLDGLTPEELAGMAALFVYEARREDVEQPDRLPTVRLDERSAALSRLATELRTVEEEVGVRPFRDLDAGFVAPAVRWAQGASLEDSIGELELSGGDFVRNIKQCIDLLDQLDDVCDDPLASSLTAAVRALRRGIVDA